MATDGAAFTSLQTFGDAGFIHPDLVPAMTFSSFNMLDFGRHGTSVAGLIGQSVAAGLYDSLATNAATPTPEPSGLFLAVIAQWGLFALVLRRRGHASGVRL